MAKKRKTRKELLNEPDEFLTISSKLIQLGIEHKKQITYAVATVLVVVLVISGIRFFSNRAEKNAAALLDQSLDKYNRLRTDKKPDEVYQDVSADFRFILDNYNGKESAKLARLILANICYDAGKYQEAIERYKKSLADFTKHPMIHNQILSNLGYANEQVENYADAVGYFEKIASAPESIIQDEALYHLGILYDKMGEREKSIDAYNKILSDHHDFIYIDLVKERLAG